MLNRLKKNDKKGFTLVELIVVLVILAILAALLIPALTGYIDKAKEKQITAETRQIVMAAQTLLDEEYAKADAATTITFTNNGGNNQIAIKKPATGTKANVEELSEISNLENNSNVKITVSTTDKGKIGEVIYAARGKVCKYDGTQYVVIDGADVNVSFD